MAATFYPVGSGSGSGYGDSSGSGYGDGYGSVNNSQHIRAARAAIEGVTEPANTQTGER